MCIILHKEAKNNVFLYLFKIKTEKNKYACFSLDEKPIDEHLNYNRFYFYVNRFYKINNYFNKK